MIAAGILPACTSVWHRAVLELVRAGWWRDLPGADRFAPGLWLAIPAAVTTVAAVLIARHVGARGLVVVLGLAGMVHPMLPAMLAPIGLVVRRWPDRRDLVKPALAACAMWIAAWWFGPGCSAVDTTALAGGDLARAWLSAIGYGGLVLIVLDVCYTHERAQLVAVGMLCLAAVLITGGVTTDPAAILGASGAIVWWRVFAGAALVVEWQRGVVGKSGAALLVALVPLLAMAQAPRPTPTTDPAPTAAVWQALDAAGGPSALMTTGGRADLAATIWRSGPGEAPRTMVTIAPDPGAISRHLATSAVYAWADTARRLRMRGMLVAPPTDAGSSPPLLWRVVQFERCHVLTTAWTDIGPAARGGQMAGVFPLVEPNHGLLIYLASARPLSPRPVDWPPESLPGLGTQVFDLRQRDEAAALAEALVRDGLPAGSLGEARFVSRVTFDRRGTAPDTLLVALGGAATAAWARVEVPGDPRPDRQPSICRSSVGIPATAYAGAAAYLPLDITAPYVAGGGWGDVAHDDQGASRDVAESAELFFAAHRPQPLLLQLVAEPRTADWRTADLRVTLNGAPARCAGGAPPCDWLLPADAMRTGVNTVTLAAQGGLTVRAVALRAP